MIEQTIFGSITLSQLEEIVRQGQVDTVLLAFPDLYGRLIGKRLDANFFFESPEHGTHACDYLLTVDMEMEPVAGYDFANWERGYGDFQMKPDLETVCVPSWLERTAMIVCDLIAEKTGELVSIAPRSMLKAQIQRVAELGYAAKAGSELEYYIFENTYREAAEANHTGLKPAGWYIEDYHILQGTREEKFNGAVRRHLSRSGIPVECSKGEWGLGQHELNVRFTDVLQMADRHVIFKQCLKEVALSQQKSVTFMAKFDQQQAGSSSHMHVSLWKDGENALAGSKKLGPLECSDLFGHFLGGWMAHAPEMMVMYAPNVNSYKRFQAGSWAPTRLAWCQDNRTASFRVVGHGPSLRIESRIAGADCNPYLAYAAVLASLVDGIQNKTVPPPIFAGDVYRAEQLPQLPGTLADAVGLFAESDFARQALGEEVVSHYTHFFRSEQAAYDRAVTDWERRRYFERI